MKSVNKQMAQQKRFVILFCKNNFNFFIVLVYLWHVLTDVEIKKLLLEIFFHEYFTSTWTSHIWDCKHKCTWFTDNDNAAYFRVCFHNY